MLEVTISRPGKEPVTRVSASPAAAREAQRAIRAGGTTGDIFRDYVLAARGALDPALEARYRALNQKLSRHRGELFYVRYLAECAVGYSFARGTETRTHPLFICGILTEDRLLFSLSAQPRPAVTVPVARYAREYLESEPGVAYSYLRRLQVHTGSLDAETFLWQIEPLCVVGTCEAREWLRYTPYGVSDSAFEAFLAKLR